MLKRYLLIILLPLLFLNCKPLAASECTEGIPADATGPVVNLLFDGVGLIVTHFTISGVAVVDTCLVTVPISLRLIADISGSGFEQTDILGEDLSVLGLSPNSDPDCNIKGGTATYNVPVDTYNLWAADGTIDLYIDTDPDIDNICANSTIQGSIVWPTTGLEAEGFINSTSGGFGFPDGSIQTTAFQGSGSVGIGEVNSNEVQLRVSGECPVGSSIAVINENGSVVCQLNRKSYYTELSSLPGFSSPFSSACVLGPHVAGTNEVALMSSTTSFTYSSARRGRIADVFSNDGGTNWSFCNSYWHAATSTPSVYVNMSTHCRLGLVPGDTYHFAVALEGNPTFSPTGNCSNLVEISAEP